MSNFLLEEIVTAVHDQKRGYVYGYGMDSTFTGFANMMVEASPANVDAIRAMFYDQNGGAMCEVREMTEEERDEYL